jgi:ornithine decarboxylase
MSLSLVQNRREDWLRRLLAEGQISTPALVADCDEIDAVLNLFSHHIPEAKLYYAVKANNALPILQYLASKGLCFDVASATEIAELRSIGVSPNRLILSNPVKSPVSVNAFFDQGLRLAVIDNQDDLESLARARMRINNSNSEIGILTRIRIPTTDIQIDLNQKFGCTVDEAVNLLRQVHSAGFKARGVQFHVGTQSWNVNNYKIGMDLAFEVIDRLATKHNISADTINIGGGFPDPVVAREGGGFEQFFSNLRTVLSPAFSRGLNLIAEPGRVIVSGACSAVCRIIGRSVRNGTPWLYLDDGAYGLFSGKFFDHKEFHFKLLHSELNQHKARKVPYVVAGPTCDSLDLICQTTLLPMGLQTGDILCAHNMGAYSYSTACNFNGFGQATVALYAGRPSESLELLPSSNQNLKTVGNS